MPDCIVRAGESVDPGDRRLSDTACVIEPGVIIKPPPDLSVAVESPRRVNAIKPPVIQRLPEVTVTKTEEVAKAELVEKPEEVTPAVSHEAVVQHNELPPPAPNPEDPGDSTSTILMLGVAVAAVGAVAATSATGGISSIQAKLASVFGSSKGAVVATATVTAGTIVAVKALEKKMNTLEKDLEKTKQEVGDASSSIDRIDSLLDKLSS